MLVCYKKYDAKGEMLCILDTKTMKFRLMKTLDVAKLVAKGHIIGGIRVKGNRVGISVNEIVSDLNGNLYQGISIDKSLDLDYLDGKLQIILGDMEYINLDISVANLEEITLLKVLWATYIDCSYESCLLVYVEVHNVMTQYTVRYVEDKWVVCDAIEVDTSK